MLVKIKFVYGLLVFKRIVLAPGKDESESSRRIFVSSQRLSNKGKST